MREFERDREREKECARACVFVFVCLCTCTFENKNERRIERRKEIINEKRFVRRGRKSKVIPCTSFITYWSVYVEFN